MELPFIGVSGPTSKSEVDMSAEVFRKYNLRPGTAHEPSLNFLVSYKTLDDPNLRHENRRYPLFCDLPVLLEAAKGRAVTAIHYNSRRPEILTEDARKILASKDIYDRDLCRTLQINIPYYQPDQLIKIKKDFPKAKLIFQMSNESIRGMTKRQIIDYLKDYPVDYVMIDLSRGRGLELDIDSSSEVYKKLKPLGKTTGFAGGLNGFNIEGTVRRFRKLLGTNRFSVDAESGLRVEYHERHGGSHIEKEKLESYIRGAVSGFSEPIY